MPVPAHVIVATAVALVLAASGPIAQLPAERRPQYEQAGRELREWSSTRWLKSIPQHHQPHQRDAA